MLARIADWIFEFDMNVLSSDAQLGISWWELFIIVDAVVVGLLITLEIKRIKAMRIPKCKGMTAWLERAGILVRSK